MAGREVKAPGETRLGRDAKEIASSRFRRKLRMFV
jgi:hypothetical protein